MTADDIQRWIEIAFTLEALSDKPGCTTRWEDLPGKPLSDFLIAGLNAGAHFRRAAQKQLDDPNAPIFSEYVESMKGANRNKGPKTVNIGLTEVLFTIVAARIRAKDGLEAIDIIPSVLQSAGKSDLEAMLRAREVGWKTSEKEAKRGFRVEEYAHCTSPWQFYVERPEGQDPAKAIYQWSHEMTDGMPILRMWFEMMPSEPEEMLKYVKGRYLEVVERYPLIRKGIIADMCAGAIFLRLSDTK